MTFNVDLSGLNALARDLQTWSEAVKEEVAMAGVAGGAKVLYDEARIQAPISAAAHIFYGRDSKRTGVTYRFEPGTLRAAIYRAFMREQSTADLKSYRISWNHIKAPYGHMVEFGTKNAPAHPFLGAALASLPQAYAAAKVEMGAALLTLRARSA